MDRDLAHLYQRMRSIELEQLRDMHIYRLKNLQNLPPTYHRKQAMERIEYRIRQLTVELEARKLQLPLDLK